VTLNIQHELLTERFRGSGRSLENKNHKIGDPKSDWFDGGLFEVLKLMNG
jgi:hypothetical protein